MNLLEQLALLAKSKVSSALGGGLDAPVNYKTVQLDRLLKDAERRIELLAERQKQTQAKIQRLDEEVKTGQGAISQAEQEVDAALKAGDDELARARLARAKAMRLKAEAEEKRLKDQERMTAQLEEEIAVLRRQTQRVREQYAQTNAHEEKAPPTPSLAEAAKQERPSIPSAEKSQAEMVSSPSSPLTTTPEMEEGSLADALRKLQGK